MAKLGDLVGKPVHQLPEQDASLPIPFGKVGIEIETEGWKGDGAQLLPKIWEYHIDGSLRNNGMEFTTRGGVVGKDIQKTVRDFCAWAKARKLDVGYPRAGIHIHLDCTDMDFEAGNLQNMLGIYMMLEHALYGFAGEWRRTCGFCDPLTESQLPMNQLRHALFDPSSSGKMLKGRLDKLGRYYGLNLKALNKYGTVEYRQLETTYDAERINNWINTILQLKKVAMNWPANRRLLPEVSREGATEFAKRMLGPCWPHLQKWFREDQLWAAVDSAIVMMEGDGGTEDGGAMDWNEVHSDSPVLNKKGPIPNKARKQSKLEAQQDLLGERDDFEDRDRYANEQEIPVALPPQEDPYLLFLHAHQRNIELAAAEHAAVRRDVDPWQPRGNAGGVAQVVRVPPPVAPAPRPYRVGQLRYPR